MYLQLHLLACDSGKNLLNVDPDSGWFEESESQVSTIGDRNWLKDFGVQYWPDMQGLGDMAHALWSVPDTLHKLPWLLGATDSPWKKQDTKPNFNIHINTAL